MTWPAALALFGLGYTIPFAWHHAQRLADSLTEVEGVRIPGVGQDGPRRGEGTFSCTSNDPFLDRGVH
ncbi:hypothetical protein JOF57_002438 [Mycolicibacterium lutetiense]|uniref:Uncharacterized protein n=1 Tax=Mycolicibacterium lutetiense TaxID=1641992 RepID=A0ABS4ZSM2_9MYCO|nr:hypothetical protein [Mycolicibacterium lutetiense]